MKPEANDGVRKLINDPISSAMVMDDDRIEDVIVKFVSVLNKRKGRGGD
ncbi:MAG: hypothetical protein H6Q48_1033 [Deltaproteobacteria bacterium]|jgi:hypothetical protein|nr:hypothetical protein [Deltaproteobacteria bacterium]